MSLVPTRITEPELVHPDQYLASEVDPLFEAQYPDVATRQLLDKTSDKDHQDLTVCMVNPGEWEVTVPKGKTVQQIQPLTGQVHVNYITVEQKEVDSTPDTILTHKNNTTTTGIVMPGITVLTKSMNWNTQKLLLKPGSDCTICTEGRFKC